MPNYHSLVFSNSSATYVNSNNGGYDDQQNFSWSLWLKVPAVPPPGIQWVISQGDNSTSTAYIYFYNVDGHLHMNDPVIDFGLLTANTWYHVGYTHVGGGNSNAYLNGVNVASGTPSDNASRFSTLTLGSYSITTSLTGDRLTGQIADFRFFETTLSGADMTSLASGGTVSQTLFLEWPFTEGSGTTVADSSGNSNNGTLVNGVTWSTDIPSQLAGNPTLNASTFLVF